MFLDETNKIFEKIEKYEVDSVYVTEFVVCFIDTANDLFDLTNDIKYMLPVAELLYKLGCITSEEKGYIQNSGSDGEKVADLLD